MKKILEDRIFIIAEAGVNHNGDLNIAKKLVDAAVEAKADAVKFQTFRAERLAVKNAEKAEYQKVTTNNEESQFEMLKRLELPCEYHIELKNYCMEKGIIFLSTPFDIESADFLEKIDIAAYKISSGDITNMPMLKHIARRGRPIILSTGMANLGEVEEAVDWIIGEGNKNLILLHCTTSYPASFENVNLNVIKTLLHAFKLPVGYSDHTKGIEVSIAAAALGARVIEKHFTLDRNMEGPDHKASLEPNELKCMVAAVRNIEKAMGDGIKRSSPEEMVNIQVARKSLVAANNIEMGKKIEITDLTSKRPCGGIEPKHMFNIAGCTAKRSIKTDEIIMWSDIDY